jgi:antitoxin component YwqK of YwqJK toxin-antitoxin module
MDDLVERDGLFYKKFSNVPFTGAVEGRRQGIINNGKREGCWISFYENGQLSGKYCFKNGIWDGPVRTYYPTGQVYSEGIYKTGKREGRHVEYFSNGLLNKESSGFYRNDVKISD